MNKQIRLVGIRRYDLTDDHRYMITDALDDMIARLRETPAVDSSYLKDAMALRVRLATHTERADLAVRGAR